MDKLAIARVVYDELKRIEFDTWYVSSSEWEPGDSELLLESLIAVDDGLEEKLAWFGGDRDTPMAIYIKK